MAVIRPFKAVYPTKEAAAEVAALPYDVYSSDEAREIVADRPLSFLRIDRAETQFPEGQDMYAPCVYEKAAELLNDLIEKKVLLQDEKACYYVYELTMDGRTQTGVVAVSSVDDYLNNVIKKHEKTRKDKEQDRINHVDVCSAQTGPIFLAYRAREEIRFLTELAKEEDPIADFTAEDGVRHRVWRISEDEKIEALTEAFGRLDHTYIADGHHRAASAVAVSLKRREAHPGYTGEEEFNYFLSVLFPDEELRILDYNRVLKDLRGFSYAEILNKLETAFKVEKIGADPYRPRKKGEMGFLLDDVWYRLTVRDELVKTDPVGALDVEYLQREALEPIWKIKDPRTDDRIGFVGGIRGLSELEKRCKGDCSAAFAMYPTSIEELFDVADAGLLMPPKSTWFEPKLRSGLLIHLIEK